MEFARPEDAAGFHLSTGFFPCNVYHLHAKNDRGALQIRLFALVDRR